MSRTLAGSVSSAFALFSAGISSSSTSVVLPLPDTPVTAVNRFTGRLTDSACTVCSALVSKWIAPRSNSCPSGQRGRTSAMGSGAGTESGAASGASATQALAPADAAGAFGVAAAPAGAFATPFVLLSGRYRPISERSSARSSVGVPQATTCPPPAPASGPISTR